MTALVIVEGIVIALLVLLVAGLLRSHADILRRLHALDGGGGDAGRTGGLQVVSRSGAVTPEAVSGVSASGSTTTIALRGSRGLTLLAFLSSGCTTCRPFWEALGAGAEMPADDVRAVVVTKGPGEESPSRIADLAPAQVPTVMSSQAWDDFKIPVAPYFVLVDAAEGRVIGEGAAASWAHVRDLLAQALADAGHPGSADTKRRAVRTEERLQSAGLEPGDPSLYRNPHEEDR